ARATGRRGPLLNPGLVELPWSWLLPKDAGQAPKSSCAASSFPGRHREFFFQGVTRDTVPTIRSGRPNPVRNTRGQPARFPCPATGPRPAPSTSSSAYESCPTPQRRGSTRPATNKPRAGAGSALLILITALCNVLS